MTRRHAPLAGRAPRPTRSDTLPSAIPRRPPPRPLCKSDLPHAASPPSCMWPVSSLASATNMSTTGQRSSEQSARRQHTGHAPMPKQARPPQSPWKLAEPATTTGGGRRRRTTAPATPDGRRRRTTAHDGKRRAKEDGADGPWHEAGRFGAAYDDPKLGMAVKLCRRDREPQVHLGRRSEACTRGTACVFGWDLFSNN